MRDVQGTWNDLVSWLRQIIKFGPNRPKFYKTIPDIFNYILPKLVLYDDLPEQEIYLVHYTTWKNALAMFNKHLDSPALRMYNYEQSNDPEEGRIKPPEWKKVEEEVLKWSDTVLKNGRQEIEDIDAYGCSFSSGLSGVEDDLTYWRLYGNDGQGCSLKISGTHGEKVYKVYKVRYRNENFDEREVKDGKEDEEIARRLKELFEIVKEVEKGAPGEHKHIVGKPMAEGLLRIIHGYYHLIKRIDYADEKEWRMIRVMQGSDEIQYDTTSENVIKRYVEGPPLKELLISKSTITIGPTIPNRGAARAYLEHLSRKHGIKDVVVRNSNKTYRRV